jgi:hypothetical protein
MKPTIVQRSPDAQSASLWQGAPPAPMPAGAHVRIGPQYDPAVHSSLTVHIAPLAEQPQGAHFPALHARPVRQSLDVVHGLPVPPAPGGGFSM